ncbi:MAG: isopentenyl-diphosphate Delta-isomerase [Chitinophagaceae bacterium]
MRVEQVILVDEKDSPVGVEEKMLAHQLGLLHRAFSVFIFNAVGEMLLQQRALHKYHSPGLWTNACCSHPQPGEETQVAAQRRLMEEMGFEVGIEKIFDFIYNTEFENGLTEYEFDHVFAGEYNGPIDSNDKEVMDYCFKGMEDIRSSIQIHPEKFTAWFHLAFPRIEEWWNRHYFNKAAYS